MSERPHHFTPARLSPVPVEPRACALPYALTWADLRGSLPGCAAEPDGRAWTSYAKQGLNKGPNSTILTLEYAAADGPRRTRTVFVKQVDDPVNAEAAKYRFLSSRGIPTPRLLATVVRGGTEVVVLEFVATIGIEPDETDDLLSLVAALNAVDQPPRELFTPRPGLPAGEFHTRVENAVATLARDPAVSASVPVEPRRWLAAYTRVERAVATYPLALNHGELYFQQVGWAGTADERRLVVFDLETMALLPRFTDVAALLREMSAQTGRTQRELFGRYLRSLHALTGHAVDETPAWDEVRMVRILSTFEGLPWYVEVAGQPEVPDPLSDVAADMYDDLTALGLLD